MLRNRALQYDLEVSYFTIEESKLMDIDLKILQFDRGEASFMLASHSVNRRKILKRRLYK